MQSIHKHTQTHTLVKMPQMSHTFIINYTGLQTFALEDNNATDSQQKISLQRKKNKVLCRVHHTRTVSCGMVHRTGTFRSDECSASYTPNPLLFLMGYCLTGILHSHYLLFHIMMHSREMQRVWIAIESNLSRHFFPDYRNTHWIWWATKIFQVSVTRLWFLSKPLKCLQFRDRLHVLPLILQVVDYR